LHFGRTILYICVLIFHEKWKEKSKTMAKIRYIIFSCLVFCGLFVFSQTYTATESLFSYYNISTFCPSLTALDDSSEVSLIFFKKNYLKEYTSGANTTGYTGIKGLYETPFMQNKMGFGIHMNYEESVIRYIDGIPTEYNENIYSANMALRYSLNNKFILGAKVGYNYQNNKLKIYNNPSLPPETIPSHYSLLAGVYGIGYKNERIKTGISHNILFKNNNTEQYLAFYIEPKFRIKNSTISPYVLSFTDNISDISDVSMLFLPRIIGVHYSHNRLFINLATFFDATKLSLGYGFLNNRLKTYLSYVFFHYHEGIDNIAEKQNQNYSSIINYRF